MSAAFDVSVYLMACARDCLDEPPLFGPRRMVEAAARLAAAQAPGDQALSRLGDRIEERRGALLGMDRDAFAVWLDEVVGELAGEVLERELAREATGPELGPDEPNGVARPAPLVARLWEAYNAHDARAAAGLYRDDATHHEVAQGRTATGPTQIADGLGRFLQAFPDARWEPQPAILSDGRAAVPYRLTGTLEAPLGPFRTPGQKLDLEGVFVIETDHAHILATADYWDAATFGRQMQAGN
jgi:steroid delta-isomerase-like uncharacterized protein